MDLLRLSRIYSVFNGFIKNCMDFSGVSRVYLDFTLASCGPYLGRLRIFPLSLPNHLRSISNITRTISPDYFRSCPDYFWTLSGLFPDYSRTFPGSCRIQADYFYLICSISFSSAFYR